MIGGNTTAEIQVRTSAKNAIGEAVKAWTTVDTLRGFLDLSSGETRYTTYSAKVQESSHLFISDWKELGEDVRAENSRLVINGAVYDVTLIDDPMGLHKQLEIFLQYRGGQNASRV